jgi:hypothetical protein
VSELYSGRQFVGVDLHRRRSLLMRMTESGEHLENAAWLRRERALSRCVSQENRPPMSGAAPSVAGEHWLKPPSDGQPHHRGGIGVGQHVNPAPSESLRLHEARQFQFA